MKRLSLWILGAILLGVASGLILPPNPVVDTMASLFLRLLKMIVLPLIVTSLVTGVLSVRDIRRLGQMGLITLLYYLSTSALAVGTGLVIVNLLHPRRRSSLELPAVGEVTPAANSSLGDIILNLVPDNPFHSLARGQVLPVIFFSLLLGIVILSFHREEVHSIVRLFEEAFRIMMRMTTWVLYLAPLGIWALVTRVFSTTGLDVFIPLFWYFLAVFLALLIHISLTLPLITLLIGRRSPAAYFHAIFPAFATAFSTASSSATLPLTIECVEKRAGIDNRVSSFVLPLGATINMDGTALYEAVAAIFIAEAYGVTLTLSDQIVIFLTAVLASIGAAGIPMAGLVMMAIVLNAVGLPLEGVGLIVGVDRVLDMLRTATNVWSDTVGCVVVDRLAALDEGLPSESPPLR